MTTLKSIISYLDLTEIDSFFVKLNRAVNSRSTKNKLNEIINFFTEENPTAVKLNFNSSVFNFLNESLITGEFFSPNAEEVIYECFEINSEIELKILKFENELNLRSKNKTINSYINQNLSIYKDFLKTFKTNIQRYIQISSYFNRSFKENETFYIGNKSIVKTLSIKDISRIAKRENTDRKFDFQELLFAINCFLVELDCNYHGSKLIEKDIMAIKSKLDKLSLFKDVDNPIQGFLESKTDFLIAKYFYREWIKADCISKFRLTLNRESKSFLFTDIIKSSDEYFDMYIKDIELLYNPRKQHDFKEEAKLLEKKFLNNELKSTRDIHFLCKYFRKIKKDLSSLEKLLKYVVDLNSEEDSKFPLHNIIALERSIVYIQNSIIRHYSDLDSFELSKVQFTNLKNQFDSFTNFQAEKNRHDHKLYQYWHTLIEKLIRIEYSKKTTNAKKIAEIISGLDQSIKKYTDSLQLDKDNQNLHIYSKVEECSINIENEGKINKFYCDSSYILPSYYDSEKFIKSQVLRQLNNTIFTADIKLSELLPLQAEKKAEEIVSETIKKRNQEENLKQIQILGVFAAVVSFVVASVGGLPEINDPFLVFYFMIGFVLSMIGFVVSLVLIAKPERFRNNKKDLIFGFIVVILLMLIPYVLYAYQIIPHVNISKETANHNSSDVGILTEDNKDSILIYKSFEHFKNKNLADKALSKVIDSLAQTQPNQNNPNENDSIILSN